MQGKEAFALCLNPDSYFPESSWFASQAPCGSTGAQEGQSPNLYDRHREGSGRQLTLVYFAAPPSSPEERPSCTFSCPCPQPSREVCPKYAHPPTHAGHPCQELVRIKLALHLLMWPDNQGSSHLKQTKNKNEKDGPTELTPEEAEVIQDTDENF